MRESAGVDGFKISTIYTKEENQKMKNKLTNYAIYGIVALLAVSLVFWEGGLYDKYLKAPPPTTGVTTTIAEPFRIVTEPQPYTGQSKVDVITRDKHKPSTDLDVCVIHFVNGDRKTDVASTGTADITTDAGKSLTLFAGNDRYSAGDFRCDVGVGQNSSADWYFKKLAYSVPNEEAPTAPTLKLCKETASSPTLNFYEEDNYDTIHTTTNNQSIAKATTYVLPVKLKGIGDECYGQPLDPETTGLDYSAILCIANNKTDFDDVELRAQGTSDEFPIVTVPDYITTGTRNETRCWALSGVSLEDATSTWIDMYLDTQDDYTIANSICAQGILIDVGMYEHADLSGVQSIKFGYQDEDGNDVGITSHMTRNWCYE
jgi:hypothetical protein